MNSLNRQTDGEFREPPQISPARSVSGIRKLRLTVTHCVPKKVRLLPQAVTTANPTIASATDYHFAVCEFKVLSDRGGDGDGRWDSPDRKTSAIRAGCCTFFRTIGADPDGSTPPKLW